MKQLFIWRHEVLVRNLMLMMFAWMERVTQIYRDQSISWGTNSTKVLFKVFIVASILAIGWWNKQRAGA